MPPSSWNSLALPWFVAVLLLSACGSDEQARRDTEAQKPGDAEVRDATARDGGSDLPSDAGSAPRNAANRIASSASHSCALRNAGLYCWGDNTNGQLGTGDLEEHEAPVAAKVAGSDIVEVAAASGRSCVRRASGTVACWGGNEYGQLGDGTRTASQKAIMVEGIDDARELALNEESSCVLRADGTVSCWGGALDDDSPLLRPQTIAGLPKQVELSGGGQTAYCGRDAEGAVRCWSHDWNKWSEARLVMLKGAKALAMTALDEICALVESGEIVCHNLENGHLIPLDESAGSVRVTSGPLVACGQKSDASWRCWNVLAPMLEETGSAPLELASEVPLVEVAVAGLSGCALRQDDKVACLSANSLLLVWTTVDGLPD